jgi:wobble nucleotide-excising tRNase
MINKIISIKNIGRFVNYSVGKNVDFQKFTIIFGDNGRGKSTLSAIFRSLSTGQSCYINEKRTIGKNTGEPEVSLLLDTKNVIFKNGVWARQADDFEIFDHNFIDENVYSGCNIGHDHKKNLFHFAIGEQGVKKSLEFEKLERDIKELTFKIHDQEQCINKFIKSDLNVSSFVNLACVDDIAKQISVKQTEIYTFKKGQEIANKPILETVLLPKIPIDQLKNILLKSLDNVSKEAETQTKAQIDQYMDHNGERWINTGLSYIKENTCPFCGNSLNGNVLITAYQDFFSIAYDKLKEDIKSCSSDVKQLFSAKSFQSIQKKLIQNNSLVDYWNEYVTFEYNAISIDNLNNIWISAQTLIDSHLDTKSKSPLEKLGINESLTAAINSYNELTDKIEEYNQSVVLINTIINDKKRKLILSDISVAEKELNLLYDVDTRYKSDVNSMCINLSDLHKLKTSLDDTKKKSRKELDEYTKGHFEKYEKRINYYLEIFGASFSIVKTTTQYAGGKPSTNYNLCINDVDVELINTAQSGDNPCFKNTLSEGEKSTLAFAFFFAKLDLEPNLGNKIIILDDPITSLDGYRKTCTQQQITRLSHVAKQVIVLSHDQLFLRLIWDNVKKSEINALQIVRQGNESIIIECDILKETEGEYFKNYSMLCQFLDGKPNCDLRATARCIRPVLEGNFRVRFAGEFKQNEWLGEFVKKIRTSKEGDKLFLLKPQLEEISNINDFSKKYHHDQNPTAADTIAITDQELQPFVKRTLKLIMGVN